MNGYSTYIIICGFCVIYVITILLHLNTSIGSEHEFKKLRNMIICYIVFSVSDIVSMAEAASFISMNGLSTLLINTLCILSLTFGCYFWFKFVEARLHPDFTFSKTVDFLTVLPVLFIAVLDALSIYTHWLFSLNENGFYITGDLFIIQSIVNFGYLLLPTAEFFIQAVRVNSADRKKEYISYGVYMLIPLLFGITEDFFPDIPVLELSIFLMIHLFFITIQDRQIYNDALTGLNNRKRLESYLQAALPDATQESPVYLSMVDVDSFKSVNDVYGHVEGDRTLKAVAQAIMYAAREYNAFAARYGGDEFCIVLKSEPDKMEEMINAAVLAQSAHLPCAITVSMGYTKCVNPVHDIASVIKLADEVLYDEKQRKHHNGNRT